MKVKSFSRADIETRVNWINNPLIHSSMSFQLPATVAKTNEWFDSISIDKSRYDFSFFDNDFLVAMGGLTKINYHARHSELYIFVNPDFQNKGWGKLCSQWLLNFAFSELKLNLVYLYSDGAHSSGHSLFESLDFCHEGTLRQRKFVNGSFRDRRIYSMLSEEWILIDYKEDFEYES